MLETFGRVCDGSMRSSFLLMLFLAQGGGAALLASPPRESPEFRATLQAPVHGYGLVADGFVDGLTKVAGRFMVPMGITWIQQPPPSKPLRLSWSEATVEQVIRDVVRTQPGYELEIGNGVVHVQPRGLISSRQNFLRLRVARFDVQNEVAEVASKTLRALLNPQVAPPKPESVGGGIGFEQGVEIGDPNITITLANSSAQDALDAISLASPFEVWLVTFTADNSLTPGGFRRTVLAGGRAVPDEYQPVWELLKWGE